MAFIIFMIVIALLVLWSIGQYNKLAGLRRKRQKAFAGIDIHFSERHDLIPRLLETVKGVPTHDKDIIIKIAEARTSAMASTTIDDKIMAEEHLGGVLNKLRAHAESHPNLKGNPGLLELMIQLRGIDNKLSSAQKPFNAATAEYNKVIQTFPSNLIATNFGFKREVGFEAAS